MAVPAHADVARTSCAASICSKRSAPGMAVMLRPSCRRWNAASLASASRLTTSGLRDQHRTSSTACTCAHGLTLLDQSVAAVPSTLALGACESTGNADTPGHFSWPLHAAVRSTGLFCLRPSKPPARLPRDLRVPTRQARLRIRTSRRTSWCLAGCCGAKDYAEEDHPRHPRGPASASVAGVPHPRNVGSSRPMSTGRSSAARHLGGVKGT